MTISKRRVTLVAILMILLSVIGMAQVAASGGSLAFSDIGQVTLDAAEIAAYDPSTETIFVTGNGIQFVDISDPTAPMLTDTVDPLDLGFNNDEVTSVAVAGGILAASVPDANEQLPGDVLFFSVAGDFLGSVEVGALPDMVTFTPNGSKALVANEGEPDGDIDPVGSISIIDLSGGIANVTVETADFSAFDGMEDDLRAEGVRIFAGKSVSEDVEPEYIAVDPSGQTAFATLQEANSVAVIDIPSATITDILGLGLKDHSVAGNGLDASDRDDAINIANWPVFGMYMPDAIAAFNNTGATYFVTANEGDDRGEDERIADLTLDPTTFPDAATLQEDANLGRLAASSLDGDTDDDGDVDVIHTYGGRSFTIWDAAGNLVFDSGDQIGQITAVETPDLFNANNGAAEDFDTRSDNKGAEPEGVTLGIVDGVPYAFIGLERAGGGVMAFDISDPTAPVFDQYIRKSGDVAPEGLILIPAEDTRADFAILVVTNEVSNTLTLYGNNQPSAVGLNSISADNVDFAVLALFITLMLTGLTLKVRRD